MKQKKILRKGMLGIILCFAMVIGLMPGMMMTAYASEIVIDSTKTAWEQGNTYVLNKNVTITERIAVYGEATLVLNEGCTLTASKGINVAKDNKLTIRGSGTLEASAADTEGTFSKAGIGGASNQDCGTVIIDGGTIIVNKKGNAAGIGGGLAGSNSGNGGSITINGGTVTVNHQSGSGAGIGGGNGGNGGIITINGGTVTATGAGGGAGIGGGNRGAGGTITISDTANVTATGGEAGAGIGTGDNGKTGSITIDDTAQVTAIGGELSAGIGGGRYGQIDSISIGGGTVTATGGKGGAGIGGGLAGNNDGYRVDGGTITITGGKVTATGGDETISGAGSGAGIGGGWNGACGKVTISGGTVTATGGIKGAGIGSGNYCQFNEKSVITITGGTITAKGGDKSIPGEGSGAGIGGGWYSACGKVTISGGEVNAKSGENGAGIGGQNGAGSEIEISGGTVTATAEGNNSSGISSDQGTTISGGIVTASGSVKAINGTIKNSNGGVGWTNTAGTKGKTFIPISTSGQKLDYLKAQFPGKAADVTFKVVNGSWNDDTSDAKTVLLFGFPNEDLKLANDQIPAAGDKPNDGYLPGSWDVTPSADTAITSATTYTYTYAQKEAATVKIAPAPNTMTYTGSAQELVTAGEAAGGEMQYALGTETEATQPYTTSIPAATDAGIYYVWYKAKGDENHNDSDAKAIEVKISEAVTPSIAFDTPSMSLKIEEEKSITVTVIPEDAKITWTSDKEAVATVDATGKVKAVAEGTATISGKITVDGKDYSAECKVTVSKDAPEEKTRVEPKELTDDSISKELKEKGYTSPEIIRTKLEEDLSLGSDEKKANSSLYELVLEVSTDGGKTWVPATAQNFPKDGLEVTIPYPVTQDGTQTNGTDYIFRVAHLVGTTVGDVEAGTVETPEVTNTEDGILVTFHGLSPVMISWEKKTSPEPTPAPTPTDISVTLNLSETYLTQGMEKALKATTKPDGSTVTWSSSDNSVAYVDGRGVVIGLKPGTATITATITVDGKEYSASCKVTVVPTGFIPSGKSDGGHTHKFVWETIEATEDADGELRYQCETCGEIKTRVPLTAYNVFNKNTTEKIRKAPKDATVKIETNKWISFHKMVMEALAERKDVTLEISFLDGEYKGNRCTVVIPKGTDTMSLVDKNGFTGFLYLGGKFGMKTN